MNNTYQCIANINDKFNSLSAHTQHKYISLYALVVTIIIGTIIA